MSYRARVTRIVVSLFAIAILIGTTSISHAKSGRVRIEVGNAGFIFGVSGGSGTLTFNGRNYPLNIGGVNFGAIIGISRADLVGTASNLRRASDIAGTYSAVGGGMAIAGGAAAVTLRNAKGVVLRLQGRQAGFQFSLNVSGMQISLR
jgi:hypothetical protein